MRKNYAAIMRRQRRFVKNYGSGNFRFASESFPFAWLIFYGHVNGKAAAWGIIIALCEVFAFCVGCRGSMEIAVDD